MHWLFLNIFDINHKIKQSIFSKENFVVLKAISTSKRSYMYVH